MPDPKGSSRCRQKAHKQPCSHLLHASGHREDHSAMSIPTDDDKDAAHMLTSGLEGKDLWPLEKVSTRIALRELTQTSRR